MRDMRGWTIQACIIAGAGTCACAQSIPLDYNWNGMVHDGEQTIAFADDPDGFRSISDRAMRLGMDDSLGGDDFTLNTGEGTYLLADAAGVLDGVMIGMRSPAGNPPWDPVEDGDFVGIAPTWDPTGGSGIVVDATTSVDPVVAGANFQVSLIYNASVGGGDFEVILGFDDGDVAVTVNAPDWFANFDPEPGPPAPGVESQEKLAGPLSGGDGFMGTNNVDYALPGEPLAVFEAVISASSLLDGLGFDVVGRKLETVTFDSTLLMLDNPAAAVAVYGLAIDGENAALDANWNAMAHESEVAPSMADAPDGYRSIGDRGFFAGDADSLGGEGFSLNSGGRSYEFESDASVVDMVMIGTRPAAFEDEADGDAVGVAPDWDPSKGGGLVLEAVTNVANIPLDGSFNMGIVYHASNGGGNFDMRLGFDDGDEVTLTINSPDWFANNNPVPPAPGDGIESLTTLEGPLSGGDGFLGTGSTDQGILDAPLSAFEAVITAESLLDGLGFDVTGRELTSITFDAINLLFENPNAAIGIYGASIGGEDCAGDCDGNGILNVLDFVCFQQEWQAQTPKGDCDGNGIYNILDFVCFQQAFQAGCP